MPRDQLEELFELARWAPNHNLTNPWRFRVVGPEALARLKEAAGPEAAAKLDRAPTLVVRVGRADRGPGPGRGGPVRRRVRRATSCCSAAHARGLAGYWRTPAVLRTPEGRAAVGVREDERVLGLIHLGPPRQEKEPPERRRPATFVTYLA